MEEKIIEFIRKNKCLYDKKDKHYKNVYLRDKLFNELATQIKIPLEKVKQRWKTLRDKFQREIKNKISSGSGVTSPKKEWKWLQAMMFLKDVDSVNERTVGNFTRIIEDFGVYDEVIIGDSPMNNSESSSVGSRYDEAISGESSMNETLNSESSSGGSRSCTHKTNADETPTKINKVDLALESAANQMAEIISLAKITFAVPQPPESPAQIFFKGMAAQVDRANISQMKFAKIQMEVLNVVTQNLFQND